MSKSRSHAPFVNPNAAQMQLQQALAFHQSGKLAEAEPLYRAVLQQAPRHFDALHFLGVLHSQRGQFETALELIDKAISINASNSDAYLNRGIALHEFRRYHEAVASYDRAIKLKPANPGAFFNRGNSLRVLKRYDEAVASFEKAIKLKPEFPEALLNLGNAFQNSNRHIDAQTYYEKALAYRPQYIEALISYSHLQSYLGQSEAALKMAMRALSVADTVNTRATFFNIAKGMVFNHRQQDIESLLIRALSEPWGRPYELLAPVTSLIKLYPAIQECMSRVARVWPQKLNADELFAGDSLQAVAGSKLLLCLLQNSQSCDLELEKFLANARLALLQFAADGQVFDEDIGKNPDENILDFFSALAQQCFINEYVYYSDDVESELAQHIRNEVEQNLMQGLPVSPLTLLAVASYFPLYKISAAQQLLDHAWPGTINNLLIQQLIQPLEEEKYQLGITRLTTIQDQTSLAVQHQYEENPYPRWVKYAAQSAQMSIDDYLNKEFPHVYLAPIAKTAELDILIAGCGTGMQAIDVARNFIGAKVLAVDLSLQSLSYAARKSHEFGITNIDYAQADILQIGNIGRIFDVIESVGVLHHMQDPLAGLQQLLKVLKPDGVMKLGFYSELARSEVVKARELIAQKGYGANAADIRRLRYEVWTAGKFPGLTSSRDFFSISECRDLLFHIQEQRFSIPAIKHMLEDRGLLFLGFQLAPSILKRYAERFPEDQAKTNLDNWHIFETENPATFISMYQFWVQNKRPASPGT